MVLIFMMSSVSSHLFWYNLFYLHLKTCILVFSKSKHEGSSQQLQKVARGLKFGYQGVLFCPQTTKVLTGSDCTHAQADLYLCCSHVA